MTTHQQVLDAFVGLPVDLRKHIQSFYRSTLPSEVCPDCEKRFYWLTTEYKGFPLCKPCEDFEDWSFGVSKEDQIA